MMKIKTQLLSRVHYTCLGDVAADFQRVFENARGRLTEDHKLQTWVSKADKDINVSARRFLPPRAVSKLKTLD